jgi:hypothetical protein
MCLVDESEALEKGTRVDWDNYLKAYYETQKAPRPGQSSI